MRSRRAAPPPRSADATARPVGALVRTWAVTIPVALLLQFVVGALAAAGTGTPVITTLTVLAYGLTAFVAGMIHHRAAPAAGPVLRVVAVAAVPAVLLVAALVLAAGAGAGTTGLVRTVVLPVAAVVAGGLAAGRIAR